MTQHFTRSTVSAEFWCSKCRKFTQHRIDDTQKGPCLDCICQARPAACLAAEAGCSRAEIVVGRSVLMTQPLEIPANLPVKWKDGVPYIRASQATADYLLGERPEIEVPLRCRCRSFRLPHELVRHKELRSELDWRMWRQRGDVGIDL